ncbi:peptide/nickel transport system ATP-binding protein/oligopeptide transport system ATP-binding protein [Paenibacillus cellulosilyticus]|uniref:Peptide/nickel transport system ATP-binding protein/oligopeptide transport system ATP-binding protein n=1 Tax=Paenibacillus cellulosilyticus TaxID=375489 RepID=A0A2V2YUP9_9BACL|nr:ABC transporter ATP-binding protein [Paenibacillus cellulosilyticus]PWW04825.1 peptide/nickel transport system ATP-binding protein/oligopeptide transport system ATP-binding protein [Paenibacillus cellulosilyticus]QKS45943.1 ABC transporter ATP-binding protein [Paenibacillus cellulosilyticus]
MTTNTVIHEDALAARSALPIARLDNVRTYYPIRKGVFSRTDGYVRAVDGVTLNIYPGETLGLVGESGCGKSSIGRTILRLEDVHEGRIWFNEEEITHYSDRRMKPLRTQMQLIFQDPYASLNPRQRIGELLAEPLRAHKLSDSRGTAMEVDHLLDLVGLPRASKERFPHEFSGGQRQRIGIARALSVQPKLIVCDEPVSALDVSIQAQILNLLQDLQKELGLTYLFIAHGLGAVKYISTRIAVMYLGQIVELGDKNSLFDSPRHPYTKLLLEANPVSHPRLRQREKVVLEGEAPNPADPPKGCRFHTRCPYAQAKCQEEEPRLDGSLHAAACHYPLW